MALKYLAAMYRPFRANPMPLEATQPRYAELVEQFLQRRVEAHKQRVAFLRYQNSGNHQVSCQQSMHIRLMQKEPPLNAFHLCRSQEMPFSFYERDRLRQQTKLAAAVYQNHEASTPYSSNNTSALRCRPVPVSTSEVGFIQPDMYQMLHMRSLCQQLGLGGNCPFSNIITCWNLQQNTSIRGFRVI